MAKFRIPRRLYYYDDLRDEIIILNYRKSYRDGTYRYITNQKSYSTIEKETIVSSNDKCPSTLFTCACFTSESKCRMFRQKVLEEKIERISNEVKDRMYRLDLYVKRVAMDCEAV